VIDDDGTKFALHCANGCDQFIKCGQTRSNHVYRDVLIELSEKIAVRREHDVSRGRFVMNHKLTQPAFVFGENRSR
jgi:hypothetical protein